MTSADTRLAYAQDFQALRGLDRLGLDLALLVTTIFWVSSPTPSAPSGGAHAAWPAAILVATLTALTLRTWSSRWYCRHYGEMTPRESGLTVLAVALFVLGFAAAGAATLIKPALALHPVNLWALALIAPTIIAERSKMRHVGRTAWHWAGDVAIALVALWPAVGGPTGLWVAFAAFFTVQSVTAVVDHRRLVRNLPPAEESDE